MKRRKATPPVELSELVNLLHNYDFNPVTREIYLHSHYSACQNEEEAGIEYRMATQFLKNLHLLNQIDNGNILVHLQSPGGDWTYGMAMYDAIEASASPVNILAHGEIASMSVIVFQAGGKRIMMPNCELMVHRGFLTLEGVATTVQANAAWNKKTDKTMLQILASRAYDGLFFRQRQMTEHQVMQFIDKKITKLGDWSLSADEAVYYGLADGVFGGLGFDTMQKVRK